MLNYYDVLGVSLYATDDEIKSKYRDLAKIYHPDNLESSDEKKFREINEAYEVLSNPAKREEYNEMLNNQQDNKDDEDLSDTEAYTIALEETLKEYLNTIKDALHDVLLKTYEEDLNELEYRDLGNEFFHLSVDYSSDLEALKQQYLNNNDEFNANLVTIYIDKIDNIISSIPNSLNKAKNIIKEELKKQELDERLNNLINRANILIDKYNIKVDIEEVKSVYKDLLVLKDEYSSEGILIDNKMSELVSKLYGIIHEQSFINSKEKIGNFDEQYTILECKNKYNKLYNEIKILFDELVETIEVDKDINYASLIYTKIINQRETLRMYERHIQIFINKYEDKLDKEVIDLLKNITGLISNDKKLFDTYETNISKSKEYNYLTEPIDFNKYYTDYVKVINDYNTIQYYNSNNSFEFYIAGNCKKLFNLIEHYFYFARKIIMKEDFTDLRQSMKKLSEVASKCDMLVDKLLISFFALLGLDLGVCTGYILSNEDSIFKTLPIFGILCLTDSIIHGCIFKPLLENISDILYERVSYIDKYLTTKEDILTRLKPFK